MSAAISIIDALDDPALFQRWFPGETWNGWRTVLKAVYGLPMSEDEAEFFRSIAERDPPAKPVKEAWFIVGRRGGKDSVASVIAAHSAALFDQGGRLRPGERALVMCLAVDRDQAKIVLNYTRSYFADIDLLKGMVQRETANGFELNNCVDIAVATSSFRSVRGRPVLCAIFDEIAFWRDEKAVLTAVDQAAARGVIAAATSDLSNISFAVSANAGALTIALKDGAGNDPSPTNLIAINFRSATQTSGLRSLLTLTAAQSITVPATSTLGFQSATAGRIWITGWDDGGTFRLGVFNASDANNVYPLSEEGVASSVQVVAAGNAVGQHYTAGAAVASKAFRTLGYIEWNASGMTTAGTWTTTNLASIQTFGTGVRKPGDVVHRRSVKSWNALGYLTTTSNVYQNHPYLQQSIFLSSAANLVRAVCSTTSKQTVAQGGCWSRITRGGSGNAVGAETLAQDNTSAAAVAPVLIGGGYDKPNATSTTYYAQARSNVNGNQITFGEFGFSVLELEEIQG